MVPHRWTQHGPTSRPVLVPGNVHQGVRDYGQDLTDPMPAFAFQLLLGSLKGVKVQINPFRQGPWQVGVVHHQHLAGLDE